MILLGGGLFLMGKATVEIHERLEGEEGHGSARVAPSFAAVIGQIMLLDIVFSLDSVITAVGMADSIPVMVAAVVLSVAIMMVAATPISDFVSRHPTVKVLALSFLLLIGVSLVGDGLGMHIPKGYIYFAMGFSVCVEMVNLRVRGPRRRSTCTSLTSRTETRTRRAKASALEAVPQMGTAIRTSAGRRWRHAVLLHQGRVADRTSASERHQRDPVDPREFDVGLMDRHRVGQPDMGSASIAQSKT